MKVQLSVPALWLAIALFGAILSLVPSVAQAHPGHQANPGMTADTTWTGNIAGALTRNDGASPAEAGSGSARTQPEMTDPGSGSTDRRCTSTCCKGTGCSPSALPLAETFTDRFPPEAATAARIAGPGPDAVPEALPDPPRSFV